MSLLVLISAFILLLTVAWSLYAEFFGLRPWRSYQDQFRVVYSSYLQKQIGQRKAQEQAFYATPTYQKMKADVQAKLTAAAPTDRQIQAQIDLLDAQRAAITDGFRPPAERSAPSLTTWSRRRKVTRAARLPNSRTSMRPRPRPIAWTGPRPPACNRGR